MTIRKLLTNHALIALGLLCAARSLAAQITVEVLPDAAERAAVQRKLRRVEAKFVPRLRRSRGDPAVGEKLGAALREPRFVRLDHPSAALRSVMAAARDPVALAFAITDDAQSFSESTTYEIDILLTALALPGSQSRRPALWAKAAAMERSDVGLSIAFLDRAYDSLAESSGSVDAGGCELITDRHNGSAPPPPTACMIASEKVEKLLDAGLAHEAVAAFDGLPAALRERILSGWAIKPAYRVDMRLSLVAARLLEGDASGARSLLERISVAAWRPGDGSPWGSEHADPPAVCRAMLERLLAPSTAADPFPLLAEFVAADLFGPDRQVWGVPLVAYGRLAEREGYPEIARFAWRLAAGSADRETDEPERLPAAVTRTARRLRAALAEQLQLCRAAGNAAASAASAHPRPAVRCEVDCERLDLADPNLFALDRTGRNGIGLIENDPAYGELFRIEMKDSGLVAVRVNLWSS